MPFSAAGRLFGAKIGAFIGQKLGPGPPKFPYSQVGWAPPSGKLVYDHTRNKKNTMVCGAQCSITVLPGSRSFYRFFFRLWAPKAGSGTHVQRRNSMESHPSFLSLFFALGVKGELAVQILV